MLFQSKTLDLFYFPVVPVEVAVAVPSAVSTNVTMPKKYREIVIRYIIHTIHLVSRFYEKRDLVTLLCPFFLLFLTFDFLLLQYDWIETDGFYTHGGTPSVGCCAEETGGQKPVWRRYFKIEFYSFY